MACRNFSSRRVLSGAHRRAKKPFTSFMACKVLTTLTRWAADTPLPRRNFDHPLSGESKDHRDCHIRPDLVLLYRKPDERSLRLTQAAAFWPALTAAPITPFTSLLGTTSKT
jgi:mRNA interferase YafQ